MSTNPQFLFDFGSPNAFLSHEAIPAIEKRTGVKFEYVPILLGGIFKATNNKSPAETLAGIKNKREFHALETERFIKRFGVKPYTWNPILPRQHAEPDARGGGGPVRRRVREICRGRVSPHVGRAEENGRP